MQKKPFYKILYVQVLIAVAIGILLGYFYPNLGASMKPFGDAFIRLVKMIIAPVIFCTVVVGIAQMGDVKRVGRVGGKALIYFEVVSTFALVLGLIVARTVQPGAGFDVNVQSLDTKGVTSITSQTGHTSVVDFLIHIIPDTIFSALTSGEILQVLFISILTGFALSAMGKEGEPVLKGIRLVEHLVFSIVGMIMRFAPIGAFGAMAFTIGAYGVQSLGNLVGLILTFYFTAFLFVSIVLGLIAKLVGFNIFKLLRYLREELLIVLGTSSSESVLPALMRKMEAAGASRPVVSMVVPTGYSFNLDGTNIYMTLATLFIAQATNTHITLQHELLILGVAMLTSKGAAAVTGGGFITLAATLQAVPEIPVAGMALLLGVDRFMSECRALTNFIGNAVATLVIARWEGQLDIQKLHAALDNGGVPVEAGPVEVAVEPRRSEV
ncbi:sodium:dicarboxylate symporter [Rhodomicrobium udaipurense JA643]|uniref:C4-dicarboxylate transport protein n=1 Tax=Rhodomicrobium udaipurense TaxID=1202716 RepID=A0A8I1KIQ0_9HYPH|nr:dicarboxylate/amino acid:cation symporter [Rhodomicrobium udaipurense]KAI96006.1 sodium:dicarboxylate symporter [Rhodomicrobium udaipurense JA643]MBJ7544945.1 dicarboxylate/amino acid:cation symporter [Rhodomicrobium udaipurense]